jgi:hypothetical protein
LPLRPALIPTYGFASSSPELSFTPELFCDLYAFGSTFGLGYAPPFGNNDILFDYPARLDHTNYTVLGQSADAVRSDSFEHNHGKACALDVPP